MKGVSERSLVSVVDDFIVKCELVGLSPDTITDHKRKLGRFVSYCGDCAVGDVSSIAIRGFLVDIEARYKLHINTIQRHLVSVKAFYHWAREEGFVILDPAVGVRVKLARTIVRGLSADKLKLLLAEVQDCSDLIGARNRAIVYILVDCGLRISELMNLKLGPGDIDINSGVLRIMGKGSKERFVRMGIVTREALCEYIVFRHSRIPWLWVNDANGKFDVTGVQQWLRKVGRKIGIRLYPHLLRHTFAISWLRNDGSVFGLQSALGHSNLEMTRRYCQALAFEDVYREHERASPIDNVFRNGNEIENGVYKKREL